MADKHYILIETNLFDATMTSQLKNWKRDSTGYFIEDAVDTLRTITLVSDPSPLEYYILKWLADPDDAKKPASVLARYRNSGGGLNYKINWIMTRDEFRTNVEPDIVADEALP